ncbi:hypothetical protein GCM10010372_77200 [Streptomyces tauricus]|nr:hypothetical protein GCM10010372_77200 [Streptomyces tauricus]
MPGECAPQAVQSRALSDESEGPLAREGRPQVLDPPPLPIVTDPRITASSSTSRIVMRADMGTGALSAAEAGVFSVRR